MDEQLWKLAVQTVNNAIENTPQDQRDSGGIYINNALHRVAAIFRERGMTDFTNSELCHRFEASIRPDESKESKDLSAALPPSKKKSSAN